MSLLDTLRDKRASAFAELSTIIEAAEVEERSLTVEDEATLDRLHGEVKALDERIAQLADIETRKAEADKAVDRIGGAVVKSEARTYTKGGESYFKDLLQSQRGDFDAIARLQRHGREVEVETRANSRTDGSGGYFVPPKYLIDQYAEYLRAGRPFANEVNKMPLPGGTDTIKLPRITTGTLTAIQASDNSGLTTQDIVDAEVSVSVNTIGGYTDLSIQLLEQSATPFDEVIMRDLVADYAKQLDTQLLSGSGASGQHLGVFTTTASGVNTTTYTDTTPTVAELYSKLAGAISAIHTSRFAPPTAIWMHPRRWAFFLAASDSSNRPLVVPSAQGPYNAVASQNGVVAQGGPVGSLQGLPVWVDANITTTNGSGTNEDKILIAKMDDLWLWEGEPKVEMFREPLSSSLGVRFRLYAFSAFMCSRFPQGINQVTGSGLSSPSF